MPKDLGTLQDDAQGRSTKGTGPIIRQPALYQMALLWLALAKHRVSKLNFQTRS
jgi:hypothetical protein